MIITTTHASLVNGNIYEAPANTIVEILLKEKKDFIFIRHSIDGMLPSIIYEYKNGKLISDKKILISSNNAFLRYMTQIISTFFYFIFRTYDGDVCYIGVDPLNAFTGILLRKVGNIKKVIFYTADYSPQRFENKILNYIYHWTDKFCVRNADQVWNVSYRIWHIRNDMGLSRHKNIFLPNVPSDEYKKFINNRKEWLSLITLGKIDEQLDYIGIFDAIKDLRNKYPQIILKIVGNGQKEDVYKQYVKERGLENNIKFLGHLHHDRALEEISKSCIGLALYNGKWNFNYYGDSMKCREYFCFGLPVISTDTHSTVEEIRKYKAGIICETDKEEYKNAIIDLIENYGEYSKNSYNLSQIYDNAHLKTMSRYVL